MPTPEEIREGACRHVRSKAMYVGIDDAAGRPEAERGDDVTQYWCNRTMGAVGPDAPAIRSGSLPKIRGPP